MKENKQKYMIVVGLILTMSTVHVSRATLIEYPLDGAAGTYSSNDSWSMEFDLGVEFTDISHVYIDWEGEITAGKAVYYNNPDDPFPLEVGIVADLGSNPYLRIADVWGGEKEYPNPEPFDYYSEFKLFGNSNWSDLIDGKGFVEIYYDNLIMSNGYYIEFGYVELTNAKLVVDGTLVPEPATILLLIFGAGGILVRRRNSTLNTRKF